MKLSSIYFFITCMAAMCWAEVVLPVSGFFEVAAQENLEPMSPHYEALYYQLRDAFVPEYQKRDVLGDNLQGILASLQSSGVLLDVLHQIASSTDEMNTLSSYIYKALVSISTGSAISGLNITVNVTDVLDKVISSGIITSTLSDLLINDTQRNMFADNLGEVLVNNTWITSLILNIGQTGKLTWETIFTLARDTKSKDPGYNGTSYTYKGTRMLDNNHKRDDSESANYNGTLSTFLNNVVGTVLGSELVSNSFDSILDAVKGSGILVPTIQEVLSDRSIQKMVGFIANKLYNYGVFDQIPINDLFQKVKKSDFLSDWLEYGLTQPVPSLVIAQVTYRLETNGVFKQIQRNIYGSN